MLRQFASHFRVNPMDQGLLAFAAAQDSIYSGLQVMTAIEHIKAAQQSKLVDEDGDQVSLELLPPLAGEEMASLQERLGQPLPDELRMILAFCSGIDGCLAGVDFTGASMSFAQEEIFPNGLPIAADGFGNYWVLDVTPETTQVAPVFFACHDPPVILYQSADMASFLSEVFRMYTPSHKSLVNDVHEDRLFEVWRRNPGVVDQRSASTLRPRATLFRRAVAGTLSDCRSSKCRSRYGLFMGAIWPQDRSSARRL